VAAFTSTYAQETNDPFGPSGFSDGILGRFEESSGLELNPATVSAQFMTATADRPAVLAIAVTIAPGRHTYSITQPPGGPKPTKIELEPSDDYRQLGPFEPRPAPHSRIEKGPAFTGLLIEEHEGEVTWYAPLKLTEAVDPTTLEIKGMIDLQVCEERGSCIPIREQFAARLAKNLDLPAAIADKLRQSAKSSPSAVGKPQSETGGAPATLADSLDGQPSSATPSTPKADGNETPGIAAANRYDLDQVQVDEISGSILYYIMLSLVGGLILNLMPCVLPVIGLKVMSFVEQAHKSRSHALVLNLWFAAGIVSVFVLLGLLAATIGLSWGGQFGSTGFNVTIAAVVFAMALSLLGVWEVPIPGFFGSGSVHAAAAQEGPVGAFLKGVVTTVLATPCTAPFMAAAVAWAVMQPLATTLVVFTCLGVGMASPYIVIGVYPELLRFLPKPGAWMLTFKQLSGFVLLATVVFVLSFLEPAAIVPTITLLLGIALACWLVARTPLTAELRDRLQSWAVGGAVILVFVAASFGWMYRIIGAPREAAWQPFSLERLKQVAVDEGRTVLVDFSAEWCINCKFFEQTVLHTEPVEQAIARSGALTMYADYTDYPDEINRTIKALRANGVPVIAIFPGDAPYKPFVFRGGYTKQDLIAALQQASGRRLDSSGQSVAEAATATSPMN
jgi:thiol:disulfide interchange protein DsbD